MKRKNDIKNKFIKLELITLAFLLISSFPALAVFKFNNNGVNQSHVLDSKLFANKIETASFSVINNVGVLGDTSFSYIGDGSSLTGLSSPGNGWSKSVATVQSEFGKTVVLGDLSGLGAQTKLAVDGDLKISNGNLRLSSGGSSLQAGIFLGNSIYSGAEVPGGGVRFEAKFESGPSKDFRFTIDSDNSGDTARFLYASQGQEANPFMTVHPEGLSVLRLAPPQTPGVHVNGDFEATSISGDGSGIDFSSNAAYQAEAAKTYNVSLTCFNKLGGSGLAMPACTGGDICKSAYAVTAVGSSDPAAINGELRQFVPCIGNTTSAVFFNVRCCQISVVQN